MREVVLRKTIVDKALILRRAVAAQKICERKTIVDTALKLRRAVAAQ